MYVIAGIAKALSRSVAESICAFGIADRLAIRPDSDICSFGFRLINLTISFEAGADIRRGTHAVWLAKNFAVGLANVLLRLVATKSESFVAPAYAGRGASPIEASLLADRFADVL